jgi:hypothetical protein
LLQVIEQLQNVDIKDIKAFIFLAEFITEKMTEIAESTTFDKEREGQIFKKTFDILDKTLSENAFKRYNSERERFEGKFLLSSFEAISIGVGSNIDEWNKILIDSDLTQKITERAKSLWSNKTYTDNIGSGIGFNIRIPAIVPLGKQIFKP